MNKPIASNKFVTDLWSMTQMLIEEAVLAERAKMQGEIETLYAMYEQAVQQRNYLMDQQRAQVEAMRGREK